MKNTINSSINQPQAEPTYPSLLRRYKAVLIDILILLTFFSTLLTTLGSLSAGGTFSKIICAIVLLTYEPLLTVFGGTPGQRMLKIRVRHQKHINQNITIPMAYIRMISKMSLGWISFVSIHFNRDRRAIHDLACGSVMICI